MQYEINSEQINPHEYFGHIPCNLINQKTKSQVFFTLAFHRDFFLPFIIKALNTRKTETRTHFADYFPFEYVVLFIITMAGVITGIYAYLSEGSVFGGITGLIASAGFAALIVFSIRSKSDRKILAKIHDYHFHVFHACRT